MKFTVYLSIMCAVTTIKGSQSSSCNTRISESQFIKNFGFSATTETSGNLASDVFTVGWCGGSWGTPSIDVDFKQLLGISGIIVEHPSNQQNAFAKKILVQYVPNGGAGFINFPIEGQGLVMNLNASLGRETTQFGGLSLVASKLRFTIKDFTGSACLKIDLLGCESTDVCSGGCHSGLCMMTDICQCAPGFLGPNCQHHECTPAELGLGDGRIRPDQITASSEDPKHTKDQLGNSDSKIGWCPSETDNAPYVQVKLDEPKAVSVFAFNNIKRQNGEDNMFIREFELQYIAVTDSAKQLRSFAKDIPAINGTHIFTVSIQPVVVTDTIRIVPSRSNIRACFRLEISGCDPKVLCAPGWCQNGGTCMGENVCLCPVGFYGVKCDETKNNIVSTNLTFVNIINNVVITKSTDIQFTVTGHVSLQTIDNKPVLTISGTNSYITLNATSTGSSCINDINNLSNGLTFAIDVNFARVVDNTYIVSSGGNLPGHSGVTLYYSQNQLHYIVSTSTKIWTLVVKYHPDLNVWQHFEITWNPHLGVELLVNGVSLGSNSRPSQQPTSNQVVNLCIGCSYSTSINVNVNMRVSGVTCWPIARTDLVNAGILKPPTSQSSLTTTTLSLTTSDVSTQPPSSTFSSPIWTALTSSTNVYYWTSESTKHPHKQVTLEDAISVVCTGSGWNVTVDIGLLRLLYPSIRTTDLFLGQRGCQGKLLGELLMFQQRFDNNNCLTIAKTMNGMKYYENFIHHAVFDTIDPNVVRHHEWSFAVGCLVSNSESTSAHFEHNIKEHNETYTAHRAIGIDFYKDPNFLHRYTNEPIRLTIGEKVYVNVFVEKPDWNSKMRLHTCYTKPPGTHSANLEHILIRDGCEVDGTTHIISQSTQETKFLFQDFQGITMESGLDIHCNATFCDVDDISRDCLQMCNNNPPIIG